MSTAPLPDYRPRNRAAYSAARRRMDAGDISIAALETYNLVVKKCGPRAYTEITEPDLATERRLHKRTIQGHLAALRDAGMLRMERTGVIWRKVVTAFDDDPQDDPAPELQPENDPEVLLALAAQEPDIERGMMLAYQAAMLKAGRPLDSLFLSQQGDQKIASETIPGSPSSYKEDLTGDLSGATPPNPQAAATDIPVRPAGYFGREEYPEGTPVRHAETMQLLKEIGCWDATVRRYGHLPPAHVRTQIEAARRCGRAAELAAFVSFCLGNGGVYEVLRTSSWTGKEQPKVEDAAKYDPYARRSPDLCPGCGAWIPRGRPCPVCYPEAPTPEPPPADDDDANDKFRAYAGGGTWTT